MRKVLLPMMIFLLLAGWQVSVLAQEIPVNYTQNPNFEHSLASIFWYGGWDAVYGSNGIASFPAAYLTNEDSYSGDWSLHFFSKWHYIWISYPVRGQEEKKMKNSFWYKGTIQYFNNYIYRDVGMSEEDQPVLPISLVDFTGADSVWHQYPNQNAIRFEFLQDEPDGYTDDWTYFEFVWDMPGTITGVLNTTMWYADVPDGYVDDVYYGEWFDGQYSGEEEVTIVNGDFEAEELNTEWLVNIFPGGLAEAADFVSWTENHTEAGLQSLRLMDYMSVDVDTIDEVPPVEMDSILIDTIFNDRNITYYLPAKGAEGTDMELSFWYKGNDARVNLEFYHDYGVTTNEFAEPEGADLVKDSAWVVVLYDTTLLYPFTSIHPVFTIDSGSFTVETVDGEWKDILFQDFEGQDAVDDPEPFSEDPSANLWPIKEWAMIMNEGGQSYSGNSALYIPVEQWAWASPNLLVDTTRQRISFMYKDTVDFWLKLEESTKYDVSEDPEGIIPPEATINDKDEIWWVLIADEWTEFSFEWEQGTWLADSGISQPAPLNFTLGGWSGEVGFLDDFRYQRWVPLDSPRTDTVYARTSVMDTTDYELELFYIDTVEAYWDVWDSPTWSLPAAADWTQWKLNWTNPTGDIGRTLTLRLDNDIMDTPDWLVPIYKEEFNDDHAGWTYFDDFYYGTSTVGIDRDLIQYDLHTYPNPASDVLYLSIQIPLNRVEIYNSLGQIQMNLDHPERVLDIAGLNEGMYFISATDENGVVHKAKFIKN